MSRTILAPLALAFGLAASPAVGQDRPDPPPADADADAGPSLGMTGAELDTAIFDGLPARPPVKVGVYVVDVFEGGAADLAGLRFGDLIYRVAGRTIRSGADVTRWRATAEAGTRYKLSIFRLEDGKWRARHVVLVPRPPGSDTGPAKPRPGEADADAGDVAGDTTPAPDDKLALVDVTVMPSATGRYFVVSGRARNISDEALEGVRVTVAFESAAGRLVSTGEGVLLPINVEPGKVATFQAIQKADPSIDHFTLDFATLRDAIPWHDPTGRYKRD